MDPNLYTNMYPYLAIFISFYFLFWLPLEYMAVLILKHLKHSPLSLFSAYLGGRLVLAGSATLLVWGFVQLIG